jgi:glycosyltransferase involved in cell wall biosynthesis
MNIKKILIFSIAYMPFVGGAELAVKEITDRINDFHFDLITLHFDKKQPKAERIGNVNVFRVGGPKLFFPFMAFLKAISLHKKANYSSIWSIMANRAGFAALFFKIFNPKVKFLLTLQEGDTPNYPKKQMGIFWTLLKPLFRAIFSRADYIQTISKYLANWARDMGAKNPIEVVPNGVDINHFSREYPEQELDDLKRKFDKKPDDKYLITTSRLVLKNAIDDVVKSLKFFPENIKFIVLGTGPDLKKLQNLAKKIEVEKRIIFLGQINHEEMPKYFKISNIYIRPSLSEGLGSSFLEAMAAGIPVIATSVGGIPDFLRDGETGLFCEVKNPKNIAEKVKILLKNNELRKKIVKNAKEMILRDYDWNLIAEKMRNIFEKI